ncbi:MAG: hypothetical protein C4297_02885 [Gemmataceae bacterium]
MPKNHRTKTTTAQTGTPGTTAESEKEVARSKPSAADDPVVAVPGAQSADPSTPALVESALAVAFPRLHGDTQLLLWMAHLAPDCPLEVDLVMAVAQTVKKLLGGSLWNGRRVNKELAELGWDPTHASRTILLPRGVSFPLPQIAKIGSGSVSSRQDWHGMGTRVWMAALALWQYLHANPVTLTQKGLLHRKDLDRLRRAPVLADALASTPSDKRYAGGVDISHLLTLAEALGLICSDVERKQLQPLPVESWQWPPSRATLARLWLAWSASPWLAASPDLPLTVRDLQCPEPVAVWLLILGLLLLHPDRMLTPQEIDTATLALDEKLTLASNLKEQANGLLERFLYPLGLVEIAEDREGVQAVRPHPWFGQLYGATPTAATSDVFVQPNMEIVLTGGFGALSAASIIGVYADLLSAEPACIFRVTEETVARASSLTWDGERILQTLHQYCSQVPEIVAQNIHTWTARAGQVVVYPDAVILEFADTQDREQARQLGLAGIPLGDRYWLVPGEAQLDFAHFRLDASYRYDVESPPSKLHMAPDGQTVLVPKSRLDLFVTHELQRLTEPAGATQDGVFAFRVTHSSLRKARAMGLRWNDLHDWFMRYLGTAPGAVIQLLWGNQEGPLEIRRAVHLELRSATLAEGILSWAQTKPHIRRRLDDLTLEIDPDSWSELARILGDLGYQVIVPSSDR